jgi:hypothetical protein
VEQGQNLLHCHFTHNKFYVAHQQFANFKPGLFLSAFSKLRKVMPVRPSVRLCGTAELPLVELS